MYRVIVKEKFRAFHYLIGGDWGAENKPYSHDYTVEVECRGEGLNAHGYLVDIAELGESLREIKRLYSEKMLNELEAFGELNPSVEHFARIICHQLCEAVNLTGIREISVTVWEEDVAAAGYTKFL